MGRRDISSVAYFVKEKSRDIITITTDLKCVVAIVKRHLIGIGIYLQN